MTSELVSKDLLQRPTSYGPSIPGFIFHSAYRPGLDSLWDSYSCINRIQDTIPRVIDIQALGCGSWNIHVNSGQYEAIGGYGGRVLYKKTIADGNGKKWYFRFVSSESRWVFDFISNVLGPGSTRWGETITNLDFNIPGKFSKQFALMILLKFFDLYAKPICKLIIGHLIV